MGKAVEVLIEQEQIKKEYSIIQRELERKKYASLTRLIVPGERLTDDNGNSLETPGTVFTDKNKVHNLLIERNVNHFSLAKTPLKKLMVSFTRLWYHTTQVNSVIEC